MKKINYKILLSVFLGVFLIAGIGFSFAYYTASISTTGSKDTTITTGNIAMTLNLGETIKINSLWEPGESLTKTFSVTNTGSIDAYYTIYFSKLTNTFELYFLFISVSLAVHFLNSSSPLSCHCLSKAITSSVIPRDKSKST